MKRKKRKFALGFGMVIAAIAYLIYTGLTDTAFYYLTVSELHAASEQPDTSIYGVNLRINGNVAPGSIEKSPMETLQIKFIAEEGGRQTPIIYNGVVPDTFREGSEVVLEGTYNTDGIFTAHILLAKCPSKYEGEDLTSLPTSS